MSKNFDSPIEKNFCGAIPAPQAQIKPAQEAEPEKCVLCGDTFMEHYSLGNRKVCFNKDPQKMALITGNYFKAPEPIQPSDKTRSELPRIPDSVIVEAKSAARRHDYSDEVHIILAERERQLLAALARAEKLASDNERLMRTVNQVAGGSAQGLMLHSKINNAYDKGRNDERINADEELTTLRQQLKDSEQSGFNRGVEAAAVIVEKCWPGNESMYARIREEKEPKQ